MMLRHLGYGAEADRVQTALSEIIAEGRMTYDLGGSLGTAAFADAIIERLGAGVSAPR
jgi:isocitrate/isopropylmalate dehydrogenase